MVKRKAKKRSALVMVFVMFFSVMIPYLPHHTAAAEELDSEYAEEETDEKENDDKIEEDIETDEQSAVKNDEDETMERTDADEESIKEEGEEPEEASASDMSAQNEDEDSSGQKTDGDASGADTETEMALSQSAAEVEEGYLRVHYDYGEADLTELGLWFWGDVAEPSDQGPEWPGDNWFEEEHTTDYGVYTDIELAEAPESVGMLVNNRDGENLTGDIDVAVLAEHMNEVWLTTDGDVYYYEPVDLPDDILRVHFQTDEDTYEPWGLWTWGDVAQPTEDWPMEAHPFSDDETGQYGAYIDLDLADNPASIGFLLVERVEDDPEQTDDMSFSDFETHRQIFLKDGKEGVFTNPYYVSTEAEEDDPDEYEGELDIEISGSVNEAFHYNENAVLKADITNNEADTEVARIYADLTELGGPERLDISPELKEITISVRHDVPPGEKEIPLTAVDETGGTYTTAVTAEVIERSFTHEGDFDWDESIIYFMLTDRFYDGNPDNNDPYGMNYEEYDNERGTYQGGDFKGVTENLDYLDDLGVNTIWITPIVENIKHDVEFDSSAGSYFGYHGYWASNFEELNPHLGTLDEFHELIDSAAERDMNIMVDVVLNHTGYGLKEDDALPESEAPPGYPTDEERDRFAGMLREESGSGDLEMELAGLPDFITEDHEVREQLVDWQTAWIEKSTTDEGNSIASYRVDTVKHVDDTTWQMFKNELTKEKPDFKLIGESWGAGQSDDHGYLNTGTMDSLLDFEFKGTAHDFVNGNVERANTALEERNGQLDNTATLGQFLGSHDESGFLYDAGGDEGKLKVAASLQMTAKGQPVIYYGEELGQSGDDNWPYYDNRYDMGWDLVDDNDILEHYQTTVAFRGDHSEIFARGDRFKVAGSDDEEFLMFEQSYSGDSVYVGLNVSEEEQMLTLEVDTEETVVTDAYSGDSFEASEELEITLPLPAMADGGTVLLTAAGGDILAGESEETDRDDVPENHLRVHFEGIDGGFDGLGLWIWEDVATPSESVGGWPDAAQPFDEENSTDFGRFVDVELAEDPERIGLLINDRTGENLSEDLSVTVLASEMDEIWLTEDFDIYYYEPLDFDEKSVRVNYLLDEGSYDEWGLWTWDDVLEPTDDWPDGAHYFSDDRTGKYGSYYDLALAEDAQQIGFLLLNRETEDQTEDMSFTQLDRHTQIFLQEGDDTVYTNPYFVSEEGLEGAEVLSNELIELRFTSTEDLDEDHLLEELAVTDQHGNDTAFDGVTIKEDGRTVHIHGEFDLELAPFEITYEGRTVTAMVGWRLKDEMYAYDGELGLELHSDGTATLKLWSPSADNVSVVLYDRDDQKEVVTDDVAMSLGDRGVWEVTLDEANTGVSDLTGYYYHFAIEREGETVLALDPYAKSMAAWDNSDPDNDIGKAAIVDPSSIGPDLDYAEIDGFEKREDAIIYEVHVRDFTSDPSIDEELEAQFGTFAAFAEKLDYIEDMGVTHIQLLPVMSYFFADEFNNEERMLDYASSGTNYNWGYDPHSYFSLTGMYSENPEDPEKRIEEFKQLIDEIHSRGMGVVLDVVYNHTARVHIFEDLEPNYYHFMDADGTPRVSYGGGRLGTTHEMSRRILVDSITYWVEEFKIDGFRFDLMGDHDTETIQMAYDEAKKLNPDIVMIGEGWRTFVGDEAYPDVQPADQDWMQYTESVGSFSDDFRDELKSGFGAEGEPRFLTGGARNIQQIFDNLTANPHNFTATSPGDVVPYIEAHDNLTLHDVIAMAIKKDPKDHQEEIHQRIRLGNLMTLTAQGTSFIHAGQEFGRTKQFRHDDYKGEVDDPPYKSIFMTDEEGNPFEYPYFIDDSYDSTDAVNMFDWAKATDEEAYPVQTATRSYTKGLIELRRSTDAFRHGTMEAIDENVSMVEADEIGEEDLIIGYRAEDSAGDEAYYIFVNGDDQERTLTIGEDLTGGDVIVDAAEAGTSAIADPQGVAISTDAVTVDALTAVIVKVAESDDDDPADPPVMPGDPGKEIELPENAVEKAKEEGALQVIVPEEDDKEDKVSVVLTRDEVESLAGLTLEFIRGDVTVLFPINNADGKGFRLIVERHWDIRETGHKLVSPVYSFKAVNEDGEEISEFAEDVTLIFNVETSLVSAPDLLRGGHIPDEGDLTWFEGAYDEGEGTYTFATGHFSKFAVFELAEDIPEEDENGDPGSQDETSDENGVTSPEDSEGDDKPSGTDVSEASDDPDAGSTEGSRLPDTATGFYNLLLLGAALLTAGAGMIVYRKRRKRA